MRNTSHKCTKIYHNISFLPVFLLFLPNSFSFTNFVHLKDEFPYKNFLYPLQLLHVPLVPLYLKNVQHFFNLSQERMYEWEKKTIQIVLPLYFLASFFSLDCFLKRFSCVSLNGKITHRGPCTTLCLSLFLFVHLIRSVALETLFMTLTVC